MAIGSKAMKIIEINWVRREFIPQKAVEEISELLREDWRSKGGTFQVQEFSLK
jgi:hypothetical protein